MQKFISVGYEISEEKGLGFTFLTPVGLNLQGNTPLYHSKFERSHFNVLKMECEINVTVGATHHLALIKAAVGAQLFILHVMFWSLLLLFLLCPDITIMVG